MRGILKAGILAKLLPTSPEEGPPLPGALKQKWPALLAGILPKINIEEAAKKFADIAAPPLPKEVNGELRKKINDILAPIWVHKVLPPMPKALSRFIK